MTARAQKTVNKLLKFSGVALHSGVVSNVVIHPAPADAGISFIVNEANIPATFENIQSTLLRLTLSAPSTAHYRHPVSISAVEHLLAAVSAAGLDNLKIRVSSNELPAMDGSASPFSNALRDNTVHIPDSQKRRVFVQKTISVTEPSSIPGKARIAVLSPPLTPPDGTKPIEGGLTFDVSIDFSKRIHAVRSRQRVQFRLTEKGFRHRIARARIFCFQHDVDRMRANGLAQGGTFDNALVFNEEGHPLNPDGLRYEDEPCRHKLLDCVADLRLGGNLVGHYVATQPRHSLNVALLRQLYKDPANYSLD